MTGSAPCDNCGTMIYGVKLTGSKKPNSDGGTDWEISPGQACPFCSTAMLRLHEPSRESLSFNLAELSKVKETVKR